MSYFNKLYAFLFLPAVVFLYNIVPKKIRPIILLIISYIFFFMYSKKLVIFIIISSLSIYWAGRGMRKLNDKRDEKLKQVEKEEKKAIKEKYRTYKKVILILTVLFNFSFLFFFKYLGFFTSIVNKISSLINVSCHFKIVEHVAPIGISFYTLQAISYLVDVYHDKIEAEKKMFKVMLYLTFFPTLVEGPITRYAEVNQSIYEGKTVTYDHFCYGYQRILWGFFKKMVIADRLNVFVKTVFSCYMDYSGLTLCVGAVFYTILLYMEFSGTMDVVIGSAEMFDISLPENFRQPFFSKNISEFWSRWHITLGLWFKDYIFYPVSLSKPVKKITGVIKKIAGMRVSSLVMGGIALACVWFLNGLWHGAGWKYLFFGFYHFTLILMGDIFEPAIVWLCSKFHINRQGKSYTIFRIIKTSILVFIGELFFRAPGLAAGFKMVKRILTNFHFYGFFDEIAFLGMDITDYIIIGLALLVVLVVSIYREKKISVRDKIKEKLIALRWCIYYALIFTILIFGAYGTGYEPVAPIYADF